LEELFVKLVKTDNDQNTQKSEVSAWTPQKK
jgi:hypothetical protein